ncbi:MAG: DUF4960 domain-containing protein [Paludibacter sp.]|nr:DUF4960 domain-containing protein [Paludibacter sp.]
MKLHIFKYICLSVILLTAASCINPEYDIKAPIVSPVSNLQYTLNGDSVKLTWTLPKGSDSLSVAIQYNGGTILVKGNPSSYTFGVVQTNLAYMFTVKAQDNNGNLSPGQTVKFTRDGAKPVTNFQGTLNSKGILLTWKLPAGETLTGIKLTTGTQTINLAPTDSMYQTDIVAEGLYTFGLVTTNNASLVSNTVYLNYKIVNKVVAFIGVAPDSLSITNPDEKAAAEWLFQTVPTAQYISFNDVANGSVDLRDFSVIWWHFDSSQSIPDAATSSACVNALKTYYANGGNFLFTTYACSYIQNLGIPDDGKAPNNIFGDTTPWVDPAYPWGISFEGHESHPLFAGLQLTNDKPYATAYLLDRGCYRLNHACIWNFSYGDYMGLAKWQSLTGGIDLASTEWDETHSSVVTIAEFPSKANSGKTICIGAGAYDWFSENGVANKYITNTEKLTLNGLNYLK